MTPSTVINAQSIGTSTNVGVPVHASKLTCESTTTGFILSAQLTNGAARYDKSAQVRVWFATAPFDVTAAVAADTLKGSARYLDLIARQTPSAVSISISEVEVLAGLYLYVWLEAPEQPAAQTITVIVNQLP